MTTGLLSLIPASLGLLQCRSRLHDWYMTDLFYRRTEKTFVENTATSIHEETCFTVGLNYVTKD